MSTGAVDATSYHRQDHAEFFVNLGERLLHCGALDVSSLERARRAALSTGERLDQVLLKLGLVAETRLCAEIASLLNVWVVQASDVPKNPILSEVIHAEFVRGRRVLPLSVTDDSLTVALVDPFDQEPCSALTYLTEFTVSLCLIEVSLFQRAVQELYGDADSHAQKVQDLRLDDASEADVERLRDIAGEAPVIRLVADIIGEAVAARASDIHIEPMAAGVDVRYRVDGHLQKNRTLAPGIQLAVTSRIKIMAKLDIAERRMPQDGRIKTPVRGVNIDLRVSTLPTQFGESVVLRILDRSRVRLDYVSLGFSHAEIDTLSILTHQPNGIFLVTGPTGSGKTTTLYTALSAINRPNVKVFTVEDPVEYQLDGINQVQVQSSIGLDFPRTLRSILRQDPDVIMIGEIRDLETARIAIQASLTGHLVLSTLHTNSSAATVARLLDMGVEHYLLGSTLNGVLSQRLVRRLCGECAVPHADASLWAKRIAGDIGEKLPPEPPRILNARGCLSCGGTGYRGRLAITELMKMGKEERAAVLARAPEVELEQIARRSGMNTLYESGLIKAWCGLTSLDDVLSTTRGAT